jgi:hypothetical protein
LLKKTITYENPFTNQEVTEDHYFHISKADLVEMEMGEISESYVTKAGVKLTGMSAKLERIVEAVDGKAIIAELKDIIRRAYGKKDGDRFIKSSAIWEEFSSSEAFSQLLFELCTDAGAAAEFMNGIVPHNLDKIAAEVREKAEKELTPEQRETLIKANQEALSELNIGPLDDSDDAKEAGPRVLTEAEVIEMDNDELKSGLATGRYKLS